MSEKGTTRQKRECKALAITGYPGAIPVGGMVNLLAGTDDHYNPAWQEWAAMAWDLLKMGTEWQSSDLQRIDLLLVPIGPDTAAKWLTDNGETRETLSDQVLLWIGDYLDEPGKPRQHRQLRLDLLQQVVDQLKAIDSSLDTEAMPGTRGDLLELCQKLHPAAFNGVPKDTFRGDLSGICSMRKGGRKSSYYRDQLPKLA